MNFACTVDGFRHCGGTGELASPYREIHTKMVGRPLRGRRFSILAATAAVRPVSSWGVLFWSCGPCRLDMRRFDFFMGRFAAGPGGTASPLPAIRRHTGNEDVAPPVRLNPARSSVKWGCALRVVERRPLFCDSVVKDQFGSFLCHFQSAQAHLQSERSL